MHPLIAFHIKMFTVWIIVKTEATVMTLKPDGREIILIESSLGCFIFSLHLCTYAYLSIACFLLYNFAQQYELFGA